MNSFSAAQLEVVERLTRRLGRLVDDLLFLARQESGLIPMRKEPVELVGLLADVVEEQQAIAQEKNLTLTYTHPKTHAHTQGDIDQLTRLFTNLIANAIQYTPTGKISVNLTFSAQQTTIAITDTGIGIPDKDLKHVFDRFYRVDPARSRSIGNGAGGSGLGLAIAKIITENHQGQLTLTSQSSSEQSSSDQFVSSQLGSNQSDHLGDSNQEEATGTTVTIQLPTIPFLKKVEALRPTADLSAPTYKP